MKKATQMLSDEHKHILRVIGALTKECHAIEHDGKKIDKNFFSETIDFVRNYADKFHHAKEEDILFKEFCKNAHLAHCNPVDQMLAEHTKGRNFIKNLEAAINGNNKEKAVENGLGYAELLNDHIFKEDNILYPMADKIFDSKTQKNMLEKFIETEAKKFKERAIKKYVAFAKKCKR